MRQYELAIRIAQIHHLVDERKYKKALAVIQTLDVRQVRSLSDLKVFAEVYTKTEQYDAAKAMYLRICRSSKTRRVLHRLVYLSIRTNSLEDAEGYYREYMRMNPSTRDALILRYRIDKAAGVPIGKLIEVLQELKQEEYIEEWAYELAKLYHRAGRREECMEECKDIMLWFGSGEIVERAKILMDHLKERDPIPYFDDKDFTMPKKEEPNPYDTGSLPDLNEFIRERKALKREERKADRAARKMETDYGEDYKEEDKGNVTHGRKKGEDLKKTKKQQASDTEFIDDYEEDDFEQDLVLPQVAKGGIQKLSGLLKFGRKDEDKAGRKEVPEQKKKESAWEEEEQEWENTEQKKETAELEKGRAVPQEEMLGQERKAKEQVQKTPEKKKEVSSQEKEDLKEGNEVQQEEKKASAEEQETIRIKNEAPKKKKVEYIPHSQSGTGITQDLAKEITAIYEMEQQGQLKEKAVTVIKEKETTEEKESVREKGQEDAARPVKRVRKAGNAKDKTNIATSLVDRMTQAIQKSASKSYIPIDVEEIQRNAGEGIASEPPVLPLQDVQARTETELPEEPEPKEEAELPEEPEPKEEAELPEEPEPKEEAELPEEPEPKEKAELPEEPERQEGIELPEDLEETKDPLTMALEKEVEEYQAAKVHAEEGLENEEELLKNLLEEEIKDPERLQEVSAYEETAGLTDKPTEEESEELQEEEEAAEAAEEVEAPQEEEEAAEEAEAPQEEEEAAEEAEAPQEEEEAEAPQEEEKAAEEAEALQEEEEPVEEAEVAQKDEEPVEEAEASQEKKEIFDAKEESTKDLTKEIQAVKKGTSVLQDYHAPEIPVVETDYTEIPQIAYEDLPTTRALQQSFQDVLRLIEGELDPSHFVLMGDGTERIVGVSKKIVHVMKASKYLSRGRIAKIRASQLNKMDLIGFRKELKGNCLLIEEASDLLFPTITKIFSIMEEYAGDFVVILSDEGTTLDQLFRFVPVLAKRFKYIIDITKYTEKDYV